MAEPLQRKPPQPVVQTFIPCHEIFHDQRRDHFILIGPTCHVPLKQFPVHVRLSIMTEFTGCRGVYHLRLALRDADDEIVWAFTAPQPFESQNPLMPHRHIFYDMMVAVPRQGRYFLVVFLNEDEVAQRPILFG